MYHTQTNRLRKLTATEYESLKKVTHYSKNLYNQAHYEINNHFGRKHRGLYVCDECKAALNTDVNGATNIIKKVVPEFLSEIGDSGFLNNPERIRLVV